jgi:holo-[acyl-carrier protein] synthase
MTRTDEPVGCRVGIDLVAMDDVRDAVLVHHDRYIDRIFTPHEVQCCRTPHGWSMPSLAARWAAKEATIKVLRPSGHLPAWDCIEVRRQDDGSCALELSGSAADLAAAAHITALSLSLTHEGEYAAAVVFALCGVPADVGTAFLGRELLTVPEFSTWKEGKLSDA